VISDKASSEALFMTLMQSNSPKSNRRNTMHLTEKVVSFVVETKYSDIPEAALQQAKAGIGDWLFVALAGSKQKNKPLENLQKSLLDKGGHPRCSIIGSPKKTIENHAAVINGCIGHLMDFDETCPKVRSHLFTAIFPAILAAAEHRGVSGQDLLGSFVIGHEVSMRVGEAITPKWYGAGWHGTSIFGIFGAAMGCAKLMRITPEEVRYALGLAATMASGLTVNFGTMAKPFHAGMAAERGLTAAQLAGCGFTSNSNALEGPLGFYHAFNCLQGYQEDVFDSIGNPWGLETPGNSSIKLYPCCHGLATNIECGIRIHKKYNLEIKDIESIEIHSQPKSLTSMLAKTYEDTGEKLQWGYKGPPRQMKTVLPSTGAQGKFSKEYAFSRALKDGAVCMEHLTDEAVNDPEIKPWMAKIKLFHNSELETYSNQYPEHTAPHAERMIVKLKNGQIIQEEEIFILGMTKRPLSFKDVEPKYYNCGAVAGLSTVKIADIISLVNNLDQLENTLSLVKMLDGDQDHPLINNNETSPGKSVR
jgi:2-methylcitrate dehydratase PrpD